MTRYKCTVIEVSFGPQEEAVFETLQEARGYGIKNARVTPYRDGSLIKEFRYYVRITCNMHGEFVEAIHPPT